jgi:hypothetical protein
MEPVRGLSRRNVGWSALTVTALFACAGGRGRIAPDQHTPFFTRVLNAGAVVTDSVLSAGGTWVDYDDDGDLDLYVNGGGRNRFYRNDGNGTFTSADSSALSADTAATLNAVWADYDNDGHLDVYLSQSARGRGPRINVLYRNGGPPDFDMERVDIGEKPTVTTTATWLDYDLDGDVDLYAPGPGSVDVFYRNDGNGKFVRLTELAFQVKNPDLNLIDSWIDFDGDGDLDLYKVFRRGPNRLYKSLLKETGNPDSFVELTGTPLVADGTIWDIAPGWGDYDNDGDFDLFLSVLDSPNRLFRNEGLGTFTRVTQSALVADSLGAVFGVWGDYDNDGDLDLFAPRATSRLYRNDGEGRFTSMDREEVGDAVAPMLNPQAGHWGDYDGDGDLDLFLANFAIPPNPSGTAQPDLLIRNNRGSENNWLMVKAVGTRANRAGIGAIIRVRALVSGRAVWQTRTIAGGPTGNNFQADLRAHFGLGRASQVDSVRIEWPSGAVQVLERAAANRVITVVESETPVGGERDMDATS